MKKDYSEQTFEKGDDSDFHLLFSNPDVIVIRF